MTWVKKDPMQFYVMAVLVQYCVLIGISEAFMDRYSLFFIVFLMVLFFLKPRSDLKLNYTLAIVFLIGIGGFSVFATKDYLSAARLKKQIRTEVVTQSKIGFKEIHAGFEYELWDGTLNDFDWINFDHYFDKKFIISRGPIPNFEIYRAYPYRRYIPFKMDTLFVLKKSDVITPI